MDIEVEGVKVHLPEGFGDDYSIFLDIISPETWNNHLTDENRESLMKFLPDFSQNDLEEKTRTLEQFFMHENFKFGTPIKSFFNKLTLGEFNPAIAKMKMMHKKLQYKSYKLRQKEQCHDLLEDVLVSRQYHLEKFSSNNNLVGKMPERVGSKEDLAAMRVRRRYLKELKQIRLEAGFDSDLSDDDISSEGTTMALNKKQRRQLFMMEASYPADLVPVRGTFSQGSLPLDLELRLTPSRNPFDGSDEHYRNLLVSHFASKKAKKSASLDTRGIAVQSVMQRTDIQSAARRPLQRQESNGAPSPASKPPSSVCARRVAVETNGKRPPMRPIKTEQNGVSTPPSQERTFSCGDSSDSDKNVDVKTAKVNVVKSKSISQQSLRKRKRKLSGVKKSTEEYPVKIKEEKDIKVEEPCQPNDVTCDITLSAELTRETHISFFSLLRDVICSTPLQRMSRAQLETTVKTWQDSAISPLNEWFGVCSSWHSVLPCAVNFLCGSIHNDLCPSDFVPYIEYKSSGRFYQWIGAGRDSDANLDAIYQYWILNRDYMSHDWTFATTTSSADAIESKAVPSPRTITSFTVKPSTEADRKAYHLQETQRYERPHKSFTFRMHGYESVVGPVKGIYTEQSGSNSKARGHSLLVDDRPPFITILSLVRDAVARLPNGEGPKADICELLTESQYIVPNRGPQSESPLNSVASGALDRLQYGEDPCVKFDTSRKSWIYLHRNRTQEEFERLHHLNGPMGGKPKSHGSSRKSSKLKKEEAQAPPPNVTLEPFASSIRQMDGSEVKVKVEDQLENWVKISADKAAIAKQTEKAVQKPFKSGIKENGQVVAVSAGSSTGTATTSGKMFQKAEIEVDAKDMVRLHANMRSLSPATKTHPNIASLPLIAIQGENASGATKRKILRPMGVPLAKSSALQEAANTNGRETKPKVAGIKVLQYPSISTSQGKTLLSGSPIVVQAGGSTLQTLVGQKVVLPNNRVLLQGGKVLHTAGIVPGNKVLTGVFPQHLMALSGIKASGDHTVEGNMATGRFVQIATMDSAGATGNYQKLAIVPQMAQLRSAASPKGHVALQTVSGAKKNSTEVRLKLAPGSNHLSSSAGSLISLGGKQIILAAKGGATFGSPQMQQIMLTDSNGSEVSGDTVKTVSMGQQLVLPASALQGSQINLKRLQTYQSFKVIPASQLVPQKAKHIAALVSTSTAQSSHKPNTSFPIKPSIEESDKK